MDGIDIGLFDYDRYNTLYFFVLNADEQIYMRYGGRDSRSAMSYLDLASLRVALEQGLALHEQYQAGELPKKERPESLFPKQIPALYARTGARGRCVECHLIGDLQNVQRQRDGKFDRLTQMYRSPDLHTIGIHLDVSQGLVVKEARGAAAAAGMQAGDRIVALGGEAVWTFADLQYAYDGYARDTERIALGVVRGGERVELDVALPAFWWVTDLAYRNWSMQPRVFFNSEPLSDAEKRAVGVDPEGFASRVTYVDPAADLLGNHALEKGDIVFSVNGVERDEWADRAELYINLHHDPGDELMVQVIRDGERREEPLRTEKVEFRK